MEFEERQRNKNQKPTDASQNLPTIVLIVLVGIVCMLLYVGWEMISDEPTKVSDISPTLVESVDDEIVNPEVDEVIEPTSTPSSTTVKKDEPKPAVTQKVTEGTTIKHTVAKGETMFAIANRYNIKLETLQAHNRNVSSNNLKVGTTKLEVPVKAVHTVAPGDILRVVGSKYNVTVDQLMKANGKTKNYAQRGEKLIIPFSSKR